MFHSSSCVGAICARLNVTRAIRTGGNLKYIKCKCLFAHGFISWQFFQIIGYPVVKGLGVWMPCEANMYASYCPFLCWKGMDTFVRVP